MGARIAIRRRPGDLTERAREEIREDAFGLDDAAVSKARLPRRLRQTIHQRDSSAARLKGKRRRDADNSGAEHDDVDSARGHGAAVFLPGSRRISAVRPARFSTPVPIDPAREGTNRKQRRQ